MKILFLTKELPYPVNSGARIRTWHYIRGIAQAGEVHMVCYGKPEGNEEGIKVFREMGVDVVFEETIPPWRARPLILARLMSLFLIFPYSVLSRTSNILKNRIRQIVDESKSDVLICDGIHLALNIPSDLPCRTILDEHNVESTIIGRFLKLLRNPFIKGYACLEWLKFRRFEEKAWPKFDEVHVCSDVDKQQVEKRSGHKSVKVVSNGVDCYENGEGGMEKGKKQLQSLLSMFHQPSSTSQRLVYSGLMGWHPNEDAVLYFAKEIYPIIKEHKSTRAQEHKLEWFIVGKDPSLEVQQLAEKYPSIIVTGFVDEVKPYIDQSDVFIVPLRIGSGTRLKILEAMAMGKAVVSTSIGCEGLEVTRGKDIFIADDPESFAEYVIQLLNDDDLRNRIAQAGRKLVEEKYDWKLIESQLAELIKKNP